MNDFFVGVWNGLVATSPLEWVAVISGFLYLIFAARESLWCWLFAAISTVLYIIILFDVALYSEMVLQFYYLYMAGYGFYAWRRGKEDNEKSPISWMGPRLNLVLIPSIIGGSVALGYIMANFADANLPYVDAFTTIGAVVATWMVTKKYLENWLYWLVIDGIGVWVFLQRELQLTALLFVLYVFLVIIGFFKWNRIHKSYRETGETSASL